MASNPFANPSANSSNVNPNAGGLFGLSQNTNITQGNTATPSLSGNTNPAPNPLQPQPTQPSLFGNTNTNTGTSTNANQNTTTNAGGGLFGQQPQQPSTGLLGTSTQGPSLFANVGTNTGGLFGQQSTGGLTSDGGQQKSTQPSLFGNTSTGTNTNTNQSSTTNTGGLFGQPPQPSMGGGIFGNTTNPNSTGSIGGTGGGLFGSNTIANNPNAGGIFGLSTNTNTNTSNQQQQGTAGTTSNPLFTNQFSQQPQQQPLSNLFSSTTSNSLFSRSKTETANPFGGSTLGASTLGGQQGGSLLSSRPNTLTSTTGVGTGNTQLEAHEQFLKIAQSVETIYQAWNPATRDCRFQVVSFFFFSL